MERAFFDDEHPDQHKSTVKLVEPELGDVEEASTSGSGEGEDEFFKCCLSLARRSPRESPARPPRLPHRWKRR